MSNNRIFYACQAVAIAKTGHLVADSGDEFEVMKGVQSVGITTNFTLEQVFELGQVELYSNEDEIAEVEVTMEKVLDGEKLIYLQAVGNIGKTNVVAASNAQSDVYLGIYSDTITSISGQTPGNVVMCSGLTVSSVAYSFPVNGNATESVTFVGNNKFWNATTAGVLSVSPATAYGTGGASSHAINGSDSPASGVVRRAKFDVLGSTLPAEVMSQANTVGSRASGLQSVSISADFGREDLLEQGRFGPYFKYATYPFEVTCDFEVTGTKGDLISASGDGVQNPNRTIVIKDRAGTVIDLGAKNKLRSISYSGGDTGGGVSTITYSYSTFNELKVDSPHTYWS